MQECIATKLVSITALYTDYCKGRLYERHSKVEPTQLSGDLSGVHTIGPKSL